jgi:hypothetical protein
LFLKISPQIVQHTDGYIVQVADRDSAEYLDESCQARVNVDFGTVDVGVYLHSMVAKNRSGSEIVLSFSERAKIFERIVAGLGAMGCLVERLA